MMIAAEQDTVRVSVTLGDRHAGIAAWPVILLSDDVCLFADYDRQRGTRRGSLVGRYESEFPNTSWKRTLAARKTPEQLTISIRYAQVI